jgi:hypothetical protein
MSGTNYIASNWRTPENSNSSKNDNYSLDFNGSSDFISCGNAPQIQLTGDISISAWFKTTLTGTMIIAAKRDSPTGGSTYGWQLYCSGGKVVFLVTRSGPTTTSITGTTNIALGEWHHVLCTINQDSQIAMILDGSTEGTASLPAGTFVDSNSDLRIGYNQIGSVHYYFNGEISEVALFDYLVSGATLYGSAKSGSGNPMALKPAAIGYWPLGDNSASDPLAQPNVAVEDASVFDFDGSNDLINYPEIAFLKGGGSYFSISMWVKVDTTTQRGFWCCRSATPDNIDFYINTTGKLILSLKSSVSGNILATSTSAIFNNTWIHIGATFNGTEAEADRIKLYVNGNPFASSSTGTGANLPNGAVTNLNYIGSTWQGIKMLGNIDETAIWNTTLSGVNMTSIYNSGVPGDLSSLNPTAWWKLDESANWEADTVGAWQIPDAVSEFPQSFNFSPANELIDTGANPLIGASNLSMSAWFNSADVDFQYLLGDNSLRFNIKQSNGDTRVSFTGSTDPFRGFGVPYSVGNWNNIILTFDGSLVQADRLKLYHNGLEINNINAGTPNTTLIQNGTYTGFKIGRGGSTSIGNWNGKISNVQLWDATLTPEKVTTLYNGGTPTLTPPNQSDLKGWYKLDNTELFNGSNWSVENQVYPANYESALAFDGADTITLDSPMTTSGTDWSISCWFKSSQSGGNRILIGYTGAYYFGLNWNKLTFIASDNSFDMTSTSDMNDGNWHNIIYTYNYTTGAWKSYIDGIIDDNQTATTGVNIPPWNFFGARSSTQYFYTGDISNVAMFNSALDLPAVQAIYNSGTPETSISSSPISWWKLDNLTTGILDSTGSNNGTNNGATKINTFVSSEIGVSTGMTEQSLVNNNVSALNGESSGMTSGSLVLSDLTRNLPYENYSLEFDGSADKVQFTSIALGTDYTLSAWAKRNSTANMFLFGNASTFGYGAYFNGVANLYFKDYTTVTFNNTAIQTALARTDWVNWVFKKDSGAGTVAVYVDGILAQSISTTNGMSTFTTIGASGLSTGTQYVWDGKISNVAIWSNSLSSTEVLNLYANGMPQDLTTFTPQPINWWTLGKESFWDGADWVIRDMIGTNDGLSDNMGGSELKGDAPRSEANGVGTNIAVPTDLKGEAGWSDKNGYSINMGSTARTTDTP